MSIRGPSYRETKLEIDAKYRSQCVADLLIDDKAVIRRILTHLGLWAPQVEAQRGPGPPAPDPPEASVPILTYHPVPDIA